MVMHLHLLLFIWLRLQRDGGGIRVGSLKNGVPCIERKMPVGRLLLGLLGWDTPDLLAKASQCAFFIFILPYCDIQRLNVSFIISSAGIQTY